MMQYVVLAGTAISFVGCLDYLWDTIKGRSKPNRVSFFLWSLAPLIAAAAAFWQGVT